VTPASSSILTINGGSSSVKFALYEVEEPLKRGLCGKIDRIGLSGTTLTFKDRPRISRTAAVSLPRITSRR